MPILRWDPVDVMDCLEVEPWVADYETKYRYVVKQHGLQLTLTIWPLDEEIEVELRQIGLPEPLQRFALHVGGNVVYVRYKGREYLEFRNCLVVPDLLYRQHPGGQEVTSVASMLGYTMQLFVKPRIQLQFGYSL